MYHVDSPRRRVDAYDFDVTSGLLTNPRVFADVGPGGVPDGLCVDVEGGVWGVCVWDGGKVVRYLPAAEGEGARGGRPSKMDREVSFPCSRPTSACFGGERVRHHALRHVVFARRHGGRRRRESERGGADGGSRVRAGRGREGCRRARRGLLVSREADIETVVESRRRDARDAILESPHAKGAREKAGRRMVDAPTCRAARARRASGRIV